MLLPIKVFIFWRQWTHGSDGRRWLTKVHRWLTSRANRTRWMDLRLFCLNAVLYKVECDRGRLFPCVRLQGFLIRWVTTSRNTAMFDFSSDGRACLRFKGRFGVLRQSESYYNSSYRFFRFNGIGLLFKLRASTLTFVSFFEPLRARWIRSSLDNSRGRIALASMRDEVARFIFLLKSNWLPGWGTKSLFRRYGQL